MEEMLKQILSEIGGINRRLDGMDKRFDGIDKRLDSLEQEISDLRHTQFIEMQDIKLEIGAVRDTQTESLQRWQQSNELMERIEMLLDEHEAGKVAVDAQLVDHERRITVLEQIAV